jgi:hypothetical protein
MMRRRVTPTPRATCCHRKAVWRGYCREHLPRTLKLVYAPVEQPRVCPHCQASPPGWACDSLAGRCVYCGQLWRRPIEVSGAL